MTVSVFLVDDHAPFRGYLKRLLEAQGDLCVAGEAADASGALDAARRCAPLPLADVLLVDVALRGVSGIELTRQLLQLAPASRVLALSLHDDTAFVQAMAAAGALGYILKSDPLPGLLLAIANVAAGARARPDVDRPEAVPGAAAHTRKPGT
ncbi:MAG: response regulator transcription factor [Rubrivivax sp.]|nr:response regulator transcription factor [Rubrivivax sp.]